MKAKGSSLLRITGLLELIIGAASIALTLWILNQGEGSGIAIPGFTVAKSALWTLVLIYGTAAIQIIAGLVGLVSASNPNRYKVCYFFGMVLILLTSSAYFRSDFSWQSILVNSLQLIVPVYYFYGAALNKKSLPA